MNAKRFAIPLQKVTYHSGVFVRVVKVFATSYPEASSLAVSRNPGWVIVNSMRKESWRFLRR